MIALLTNLAALATGQLGTPLGILALCVTFAMGAFGMLSRGGCIVVVAFIVFYFCSPWIVAQIQTAAGA